METKKQGRGRPRIKSARTKSDRLLLRLEPREKQAFANAAKIAGAPLSVWIRERLRWAATRELEAAAKPIPFLQFDDEE
jgi:predicted HicB family RNase H-like nuclease